MVDACCTLIHAAAGQLALCGLVKIARISLCAAEIRRPAESPGAGSEWKASARRLAARQAAICRCVSFRQKSVQIAKGTDRCNGSARYETWAHGPWPTLVGAASEEGLKYRFTISSGLRLSRPLLIMASVRPCKWIGGWRVTGRK
jgi:hypothetical protein